MLGLSLRKILTLFGAAMMIFVLMNVQFGSVAPRVIDGAEGYNCLLYTSDAADD